MGIHDNVVFNAHLQNTWDKSAGVGDAPTEGGNPTFGTETPDPVSGLGTYYGDLDGDDEVHYGNHTEHDTALLGTLSAACWVYPTAFRGSQLIMSKSAVNKGWELGYRSDGRVLIGVNGEFTLFHHLEDIVLNNWYCIGFTKGTDGVWRIYFNGVVGTSTFTRDLVGATSTNMIIGDSGAVSGQNPYCMVAEPVIWSDQKPAADMLDFYNAGAGVAIGAATVNIGILNPVSLDPRLYGATNSGLLVPKKLGEI